MISLFLTGATKVWKVVKRIHWSTKFSFVPKNKKFKIGNKLEIRNIH